MFFYSFISLYIDKDVLWNSRQDINNCIDKLTSYLHNYYDSLYSDIVFFNYVQQLNSIKFTPLPKTKEEMHYQIIFNKFLSFIQFVKLGIHVVDFSDAGQIIIIFTLLLNVYILFNILIAVAVFPNPVP